MSERAAPLPVVGVAALLLSATAAAEPAVTLLDLPFAAHSLRGPGSAVAVSVATSGLLPVARPKSADPKATLKATLAAEPEDAPIVVVWGEGGGAALSLADGRIETVLLGAEAIAGIAATETPRGALPGSRGAVLGPVSAHLSRIGQDTGLTIRERRPVAMSAEPKAVPIATQAVSAGTGADFAPSRPMAARIAGKPAFFVVTRAAAGAHSLALVGRTEAGWDVLGRSPPQAGRSLDIAAVAPFGRAGSATPAPLRIAAVLAPEAAGTLQLWSYEAGAFGLLGQAPGYTDRGPGAAEADLAAIVEADADGVPELALASADRAALAIVSLSEGIRERARIGLPVPAAFGVAALGRAERARLLVGLADGRIAVVDPAAVGP